MDSILSNSLPKHCVTVDDSFAANCVRGAAGGKKTKSNGVLLKTPARRSVRLGRAAAGRTPFG